MYTHQFRAPVADFVGRHSEIENIVDFLLSFQGEGCVCSIRGTVGVGKSELAYLVGHHVATHFQDGQIVVTLGGSGKNPLSREQALTVVLRSFLPTVSLPDELSFLEILYRKTLHGKKVIIIADDAFEAEQVLPLLPPPGSALLITSCNRFELPGMFSLDLQPLSSLMSEKLMRESSSRLGPQVDSNLLGRLGGFPLTLRPVKRYIASYSLPRGIRK